MLFGSVDIFGQMEVRTLSYSGGWKFRRKNIQADRYSGMWIGVNSRRPFFPVKYFSRATCIIFTKNISLDSGSKKVINVYSTLYPEKSALLKDFNSKICITTNRVGNIGKANV